VGREKQGKYRILVEVKWFCFEYELSWVVDWQFGTDQSLVKEKKTSSKLRQLLSDKLRVVIENKDMVFSSLRRYFSMRHQSSKVQALYEHCKTILSPSGSPPPSSQALQKLSSILGMSLLLFSTFNFAAFSPFKQKKQKKTKKKCILLFFRLVNVQLVQLGFGGCFKLLVLGTLLGRGEFGLLRLN